MSWHNDWDDGHSEKNRALENHVLENHHVQDSDCGFWADAYDESSAGK
jgi:hypothetical protein